MTEHDSPTLSRLLAKLLRGLLAREPFETLTCLTEALKVECARLRIAWTNDAISAAYRLIASNTPLPGTQARRPVRPVRPAALRPLSRVEAAALCRRLGVALARESAKEARHAR